MHEGVLSRTSSAKKVPEKNAAPLVCPKGEELVKGACVPISGGVDNAESGKGGGGGSASSAVQ